MPYDTRGDLLAARTAEEVNLIRTEMGSISGMSEVAVIELIEAHTPGIELGYAERTTDATFTGDNTIGTLTVTVEGQGRPVDVEFYCPEIKHSVGGTAVDAYLIQGSTKIQQGRVIAPASNGPSLIVRDRQVLTDAVSYTFTVDVHHSAAGTMTFDADTDRPMWLSVVSR